MNVAIPTLRNGGKLSKNHCPAGFRLMWLGDKVTPVHISSAKMTLSVSCLILPRSCGLTGRVDGHIERTLAIFVLAIKQYKSARQLGAVSRMGVVRRAAVGLLLCACLLSLSAQAPAQTLSLPLDTIALPPGFKIDMYTSQAVPNARTLVLSSNTASGNIVYVSTSSLNNVSRVLQQCSFMFLSGASCSMSVYR